MEEEKQERCKKVSFINEDFAIKYIDKLKNTSTRTKVPSRAYLCETCLNWHLSSKGGYETLKKEVVVVKTEKTNDVITQRDNRIKNLEKKLDLAYGKITDLTRSKENLSNKIIDLSRSNEDLRKKLLPTKDTLKIIE